MNVKEILGLEILGSKLMNMYIQNKKIEFFRECQKYLKIRTTLVFPSDYSKITSNPVILEIAKGYRIPLLDLEYF